MGFGTLDLLDLETAHGDEACVSRKRSAAILALARTMFIESALLPAPVEPAGRSAADTTCSYKTDLIEALIDCNVREIEDRYEVITASPDPIASLKACLRKVIAVHSFADAVPWSEISSAAVRKPEVATSLARMEASITSRISMILGFVRSLPEAAATGCFATHAHAICLIAHDALARHDLDEVPDPALTALIMCTIDWVLDDTLADLKDASI